MKLILYKSISRPSIFIKDELILNFEEIKNWVRNGVFFLKLLRYDEVILHIHNIKNLTKPFATLLIVRLLSHGKIIIRDNFGAAVECNFRMLISYFFRFLADYLILSTSIQKNLADLNLILLEDKRRPTIGSGQPIYLRTDFWFGVNSGGSVGHIAGVINNIDKFEKKPILITTDNIPTVRLDIQKGYLYPSEFFWDFSEFPSINSNKTFFSQCLNIIGDSVPSFIYQRYSVNSYLGVLLSKNYNVPFVLEYNGSEVWISRNWGSNLKYESISLDIELLNLNYADLIVVVSNAMKEDLIARNIASNKILVNPNGVDSDIYTPDAISADVKNKYALDQKTIIGFIGTFGPWHGAEILIEAFGNFITRNDIYKSKFHLLMIGDGPSLQKVKEIANSLNIIDYCTFTGLVPQALGPAYLGACDILISPHVPNVDGTPFFGSPTKLFEYMAMGKGIVASDLDQIGDVLTHGRTAWLVTPGDVYALADGIERLALDINLRNRLGYAARIEAINKYTWKSHTQKIIKEIKELCGE